MFNDTEAAAAMAGLLDYCERCAPGFTGALKPVAVEDVDRIVKLTGLGVPAEYRAFLLTFGRADSSAMGQFMSDVELGCDAVEAFYRDPPVPVPPDAVFLWTSGGDCEMFLGVSGDWLDIHPVLSYSWMSDEATGKIIAHERLPFVVSGSLLAYLYREAYSRLRIPSLEHHVDLRETVLKQELRSPAAAADRARRFVAVVEKLGFQLLPYVDSHVLIYDRGDAAVSLYGDTIAEDAMYVGAMDAREASRIAEILCDNLGARHFG